MRFGRLEDPERGWVELAQSLGKEVLMRATDAILVAALLVAPAGAFAQGAMPRVYIQSSETVDGSNSKDKAK